MRDSASELGKTQKEILRLILEERLSPKEVHKRIGGHLSAVYRAIRKLKEKGLLRINFIDSTPLSKKGGVPPPAPSFTTDMYYRLHGEQWDVYVRFPSKRYEESLARGNAVTIWGNKVMLYPQKIEIWANESLFFEHPTSVKECTLTSRSYWEGFFKHLEHLYNVLLLKDKGHNVRRVKAHYAQVNNGFAKEIVEADKWFEVYSEDGELRFLVDKSFTAEIEAVSSKTAAPDMDAVGSYMLNIADSPTNTYLPTEARSLIDSSLLVVQKISENNYTSSSVMKQFAESSANTSSELKIVVEIMKQYHQAQHQQNMFVMQNISAMAEVLTKKEIKKPDVKDPPSYVQ